MTGNVTVADVSSQGGALVMNASLPSLNVNVNAGGVLSGTGNAGNVSLTIGSEITPGGATPGTLNMTTIAGGGEIRYRLPNSLPRDLVNVTGAATLSGLTLTPLNPGSLGVGTYTLMTYGSNIGTPTLNIPSNTRANFNFTVGATSVTISPNKTPANLTWVGNLGGAIWDVGSGGTVNWSGASDGDNHFYNLDTVNFTGASANRNVALNISVQPAVVNVNNSTGQDYAISGSGSIDGGSTVLNKSGSGKLTIATTNGYGGGTTITGGGTIQLGSGAAAGTLGNQVAINGPVGPVTGTGSGGTILVNSSGSTTINNSISGPINLTVDGGGNTSLGGTNSYSGTTTITNGALALASAGALPSGSVLTLGGTGGTSGQLNLGGQTVTVGGLSVAAGAGTSNSIGGGGNLIYSGGVSPNTFSGDFQSVNLTVHAGTLILTSANPYAGSPTAPITDAGGTVQFGNGGTTGSISSGLTTNGTIAFNHSDNLDLSSDAFAGSGGLTQLGPGSITLASNTYTGPTVIGDGVHPATVIVKNSTALGATAGGSVTVNIGATLDLSGDPTQDDLNFVGKQFFIAGSGVGGNGAIVNATIQQNGGGIRLLTLTGDATINTTTRLDMRGGIQTLDLAGHTLTKIGGDQFSFFSGTVTAGSFDVQAGTLAFEGGATVAGGAGSGTITIENGARMLLNNTSTVSRPVQINGSGTIVSSATASTLGSPINLSSVTTAGATTPGNVTYLTTNAAFTQAGPITATSPGSVTVSMATFSLTLGAASIIPGNATLVMNSGTLNTGGFSDTISALKVSGASTLDLLAANTGETLTFGDSSTKHWTNATTLTISNYNPAVDKIQFPTATSLTPNQLSAITFSGADHGALVADGPLFDLVPSTAALPPSLPRGDVNHDGNVDVGDIGQLLTAVTDVPKYQNVFLPTTQGSVPAGFTLASEAIALADVDYGDSINNLDAQALLVYLANGGNGFNAPSGGSLAAVPEPAGLLLFAIGGLVGCTAAVRARRARKSK
jgi:autotransporter-associated beta strand protein